jgi:hypothetical protein
MPPPPLTPHPTPTPLIPLPRAYDSYLVEALGDQAEADWHKSRKNPAVRERFHPAAFEERLARRRDDAAEAAAAFASDVEAGKLAPDAEGFNQGALAAEPAPVPAPAAGAPAAAGEEGAAAPAPPPPPSALLWAPARAAADLRAALRLAAVMDEEKGVAANPLLPEVEAPAEEDKGGCFMEGGAGVSGASLMLFAGLQLPTLLWCRMHSHT